MVSPGIRSSVLAALSFSAVLLSAPAQTASSESRTAHYVASTHWDREWYESFQGFRMRLVSLFDELFRTFEEKPEYGTFTMDGQVISVLDYLEIRPEMRERVVQAVKAGKLKLGPWYVLPDEWLVSGESLVRNLQFGMTLAGEFGAPSSRAGFACDMFGHTGQLPQIFDQLGIPVAFVWRGILEKEYPGNFNWKAPDGTTILGYRFGKNGYSTYAGEVRQAFDSSKPFVLEEAVDRLLAYVSEEDTRSDTGPILLFDGGDHIEIEPQSPELFARANERLRGKGITIVHSDLDRYMADILKDRNRVMRTVTGELREPLREAPDAHLIPGVLSSRIHLKQKNAACEDELCLWAEPFSAFAAMELGREYPGGYFRAAWKHLLENHPHDSICGCSIDQVHQDMVYRFDQSLGISSRLTTAALKSIGAAAAPQDVPDGGMVIAIFNPTAADIDEPVDLDIPLPTNWPTRFQEFFGFEEKFSMRLTGARGKDVPWQLTGQSRDRNGFRRARYKFPVGDPRHVVTVTAPLHVPAFGYTTLVVGPKEGPTRFPGSLSASHRALENEFLRVEAAPNGTLTLTDKRSGKTYTELLTFEDRADIGDGWYHGVAVNDRIHVSSADAADISLVADGPQKAVLRIAVTMNIPKEFDFRTMTRSTRTVPLRITSDITLRKGADRVEVETRVVNTVRDHRVRVLFPTGLAGDSYLSDAAFDVVRRPVALVADNASRVELDIETRPQITWTAFGEKGAGLAVVSRGLPESAMLNTDDRPIALTLFRGFRRAVFSNDNPGGQILGDHTFRYWIVPYAGAIPAANLCRQGQRVNAPARVVDLMPHEFTVPERGALPSEQSFLHVRGNTVVTSVQRTPEGLLVRLFNPGEARERVVLRPEYPLSGAKSVTLDGRDDTRTAVSVSGESASLLVPGKRVATVLLNAGAR